MLAELKAIAFPGFHVARKCSRPGWVVLSSDAAVGSGCPVSVSVSQREEVGLDPATEALDERLVHGIVCSMLKLEESTWEALLMAEFSRMPVLHVGLEPSGE